MEPIALYPLKFEPIFQYRIWGGRRLADLLKQPLPTDDPIGEAWILSDRDDHPSKVTEGKLKGRTIRDLMKDYPNELLGDYAAHFARFPLLLKFLDCKEVLSVQVHPSDDKTSFIPNGETGKTEAWVVLRNGRKPIIYAGLKPGTREDTLRESLSKHQIAADLASFRPSVGDSVLIKAGTVHTLSDVVVFEVQENSDVTYRLYDWDRVDEKTGKPRDLQVEQAMACIDFNSTDVGPTVPELEVTERVLCEKLVADPHFTVWRYTGSTSFMVGRIATPRVLVCISGEGELESNDDFYKLKQGGVMLLPAITGACPFVPKGDVILLEIALPEG